MATENLVNGPAFLSIGAQESGGAMDSLGYALGGVMLTRVTINKPHMHDGFGEVPADVYNVGIMGIVTLKLAHLDYDVYESMINLPTGVADTPGVPGYLLAKNSKMFRLGITSPLLAQPYLFQWCWMESPEEILGNDSFAPTVRINCIPYGTAQGGISIAGNKLYLRTIT